MHGSCGGEELARSKRSREMTEAVFVLKITRTCDVSVDIESNLEHNERLLLVLSRP